MTYNDKYYLEPLEPGMKTVSRNELNMCAC